MDACAHVGVRVRVCVVACVVVVVALALTLREVVSCTRVMQVEDEVF